MTTAIEHTPTARGASLEDVVALIGTLVSLAEAKRAALAEIDAEDARDFLSTDEAMLAARRAKRAAIETELRQVESRIKGADRQRTHLEQVAVCRAVRAQHRDAEAVFDRMDQLVREVNDHIEQAARGIRALTRSGREVVGSLRQVRGRSTLTDTGWLSSIDITQLQDINGYRFFVERHISGLLPGWLTEYGAGPTFADSAGGHLHLVRGSVATLLSTDDFPAEVVAEAATTDVATRARLTA